MHFVVMNAPAVFQLLMHKKFIGITVYIIFLDDVIVYSETLAEHVYHFIIVFECLRIYRRF